MSTENSTDLFGQTMRTMAVLVGACILFVGSLSVAAVVITNKAMGPAASNVSTPSDDMAKKPLSI